MSKSRIAIAAADAKVSLGYKGQLEGIFKDEVEIVMLNLDDAPELFLGFDLILAASTALFDEVKRKAPLNAKIIVVIRNINTLELHKVFEIEAGSTALVVSNFLHAARETVALLHELGLNHIKYIPYSPGCEIDGSVISSANLAITAAASHFVPPGINRIVDLGLKIIDISTVLEIIIHLGLPLERINLFTLRYMKEFITLNREISGLKSMLSAVLDASSDGIIVFDLNGKITYKNKNVDVFLSPTEGASNYGNISQYIRVPGLLSFIKCIDGKSSDVFRINKKDVMVNKNYLKNGEKITGTVVSFSYVSEIQDMEKEIRKKLGSKGNTAKYDFTDIIGRSKNIRSSTDMAKKAARTDLPVLLLGENGTGKELFAQAVHKNSERREGPFVAVNFAALPENLIESELFGYEEGAFTGARRGGKLGLFEMAHMGTIFLDEIGDAPLSLQARLLRVIQEKEVLRVGGTSPIPVDVRVITATNRELMELIKVNLFRKDLYYRLNTIMIKVPPLRERKEDITYIIEYYMNNLRAKKKFTSKAMERLFEYSWPGNVRELENLINYVVEIVDSDLIDLFDLPVDILGNSNEIKLDTVIDEDAADIIVRKGSTRLFALVLEELDLAERMCIKASRSYLVNRLIKKGITITDNILRRILRELEEIQCISIGNTKQGTRITLKGKETMNKLNRILEKDGFSKGAV